MELKTYTERLEWAWMQDKLGVWVEAKIEDLGLSLEMFVRFKQFVYKPINEAEYLAQLQVKFRHLFNPDTGRYELGYLSPVDENLKRLEASLSEDIERQYRQAGYTIVEPEQPTHTDLPLLHQDLGFLKGKVDEAQANIKELYTITSNHSDQLWNMKSNYTAMLKRLDALEAR